MYLYLKTMFSRLNYGHIRVYLFKNTGVLIPEKSERKMLYLCNSNFIISLETIINTLKITNY